MEVNVYSSNGEVKSKVKLPKVFETGYRPRIIRRAFLASLTSRIQPKGTDPRAGRKNTAVYKGVRRVRDSLIAVGIARKPRLKNRRGLREGNVAGIAGVVGGPRAHGPKAEKVIEEKINKKERKLALASAIAALTNIELVKKRGHVFDEKLTLPIVFENDLEKKQKTKEIIVFLEKLGIFQDIERAKDKRIIRAGKGKVRGRKYKRAKSVLFIVKEDKSQLYKAARNLEGVDVVSVRNLCVEALAPAGQPSRFTLMSEDVLKELGKM
jgi:large subunit ribosomal protein L4e